jgi:hypothetical protein
MDKSTWETATRTECMNFNPGKAMSELEFHNKVFETTNKLEGAKCLFWIVWDYYFEARELKNEIDAIRFAGDYNKMQSALHLIGDILWDCCKKYEDALDETGGERGRVSARKMKQRRTT